MLIFNCDDYGLTQKDVLRVDDILNVGIVKSTTIAVNMGAQIQNIPNSTVSTGIHINLVEGASLTGHSTLTDSHNIFLGKRNLLKKILMGGVSINDLEMEIKAQIIQAYKMGVEISHIDSHQNVHFFPIILKSVIKIGSYFGIEKIRNQNYVSNWFGDKFRFSDCIKRPACAYWETLLPNVWKKPDSIILSAPGLGRDCESIDVALNLWEVGLKRFYDPDKIYEIPCHLGLSDLEYKLYGSTNFLNLLNHFNVEIGSYHDI